MFIVVINISWMLVPIAALLYTGVLYTVLNIINNIWGIYNIDPANDYPVIVGEQQGSSEKKSYCNNVHFGFI